MVCGTFGGIWDGGPGLPSHFVSEYEERVSNAPLPYRKHSRESNVIVTRPKTARYDVYTLIKIGIDRQGLLLPLPQCLEEMLHSEEGEKVELLRHSS